MDALTVGILATVAVLGMAFGLWVHLASRTPARSQVAGAAPVYECDPETCSHEWVVERVEEVETTIDYCSYGGPDPVGIVTYTYLRCPKCGARDVKESDPVPL
jgi:hypothetical protein